MAEKTIPTPKKTVTAETAVADAAKKAQKTETVKQNGVACPKPETVLAKIWEICAQVLKTDGKVDKDKVVDLCYKAGVKPATASTQVGRFMRFNGLSVPRIATTPEQKHAKAVADLKQKIEKGEAKLKEQKAELAKLQAAVPETKPA